MARMGPIIYLHAAKDRDRAIADALGQIIIGGLQVAEQSDRDGEQSLTESGL
jgi:hypothetical protein